MRKNAANINTISTNSAEKPLTTDHQCYQPWSKKIYHVTNDAGLEVAIFLQKKWPKNGRILKRNSV